MRRFLFGKFQRVFTNSPQHVTIPVELRVPNIVSGASRTEGDFGQYSVRTHAEFPEYGNSRPTWSNPEHVKSRQGGTNRFGQYQHAIHINSDNVAGCRFLRGNRVPSVSSDHIGCLVRFTPRLPIIPTEPHRPVTGIHIEEKDVVWKVVASVGVGGA